jgi:cobalt-zinc-cadmium efflux system membrane fusion protein
MNMKTLIKLHISTMKILTGIILLSFLLFSCGEKKVANGESGEESEEHAEGEESGVIELSEAQMSAVGITIGKIEKKNLSLVVKASGQLEVPPQNRAEVTTLTSGVVKRIYVLEGNYVKRGQTLATIENPEFLQMQQEYLTSKSNFSYIEKEYARQKELLSENAGTGKVYQQTEANYNTERARLTSLEKQLGQLNVNVANVSEGNFVSEIPLVAPISGTIGHIVINIGSFADQSKSLMTIIDNSQVHCDLLIYEKDLYKVKVGQKANFILTNQNNKQIVGEIYGINQSFENESKAIIAHAVIKNASKLGLIQGMYVSALIDVGNQETSAVPVDAIVKSQGKEFIFVVEDEGEAKPAEKEGSEEKEKQEENETETKEKEESPGQAYHFKMVEVVTGVSDLGYIEIRSVEELPEGATIVTKGAFYILSKAQGGEEEE